MATKPVAAYLALSDEDRRAYRVNAKLAAFAESLRPLA